jgi:hypothetical protein
MDIDIDFLDRNEILSKISYISASRKEKDQLVKHNTGIYMHEVPFDCLKNISSISYDQAEKLNYFKIDFLNVGIYKGVRDERHLETLMNTEPLWDLLEQDEFVNLLFHVNGHADILRIMKPKSIEQLAAVLAVIRPAKRYLIGKDWNYVLEEVWKKPADGEYYWKKSHAFAYAFAVIVQMNLICEQLSYGYS